MTLIERERLAGSAGRLVGWLVGWERLENDPLWPSKVVEEQSGFGESFFGQQNSVFLGSLAVEDECFSGGRKGMGLL